MPCRNAQQHPGWTLWLPAALFPVLKRADADPEKRRELSLRQGILPANGSDIWALKGRLTRCAALTTEDRSPLFDALHKLIEKLVPHLNSSRTKATSTFFCAAVRSSCSFFPYIRSISTTALGTTQ